MSRLIGDLQNWIVIVVIGTCFHNAALVEACLQKYGGGVSWDAASCDTLMVANTAGFTPISGPFREVVHFESINYCYNGIVGTQIT